MKKYQNLAFYIITAVIILVLYFLLQPKAMPKILSIRNKSLLDNFVKNTAKTKTIDVQEFWKMREFYCPGSFVYDKTKNPFLKYDCQWIKSEDYLTVETIPPGYEKLSPSNILFRNKNGYIYRDGSKIVISFIAIGDEMKKAVGVFDYNEKDRELVKNKNWLNMTAILN